MRRELLSMGSVALGLCLASGCGGDAQAADGTGGRPAQAAELRMQQDLIELGHLADVDHHGLFIELGGPTRYKYTVGNWGSGWLRDGREGETRFSYVGETGRLFFPTREARELTLRFHVKPVGSHRMQVFLNGRSIQGIVLEEGESFRDYDVRIPAEHVRPGENYLMLRFGGTSVVDGENVAVAMASIRVMEQAPAANERFTPPRFGSLIGSIALDGAQRRSLLVRAPTTLSYHLAVPRGGRFVFGVGAEGNGSGLSARVRISPQGGQSRELFRATPTGAWNDQSVDLSAYQGQVVRLDLEMSGRSSARAAWSAPAIMVPPPQVASRPREVRNVVVLLIDTMRADKLRPWNRQTRVTVPVIDRMASHGVLFEQAQAPENWTKPSCASVLTGLSPSTHGAKTDAARLPASAELVSEVFNGAGFATGGFIANGYVSDRFGFDQGWDDYNNYIRDGGRTEAEHVFDEAATFIEGHRRERFFVYIQTIDPHVPYDPPAEFLRQYDPSNYTGIVQPRQTAELLERAKTGGVFFNAADQRRLEALYDGEVSYHDRELGRFLERLRRAGVDDETLIVVTADHGEEFHEHGSWGHGHSIFQELLHVPLLFYMPGHLPEGRRVPYAVSTMNISQTVLDLAGVRGLARAEGHTLVPDLLGGVAQGPQVAFSDFQDIRRVARAGRYKLVVRANMSTAIFDLETDPAERTERQVSELPIAGRYLRILLGQYLGARNRAQWLRAEQDEAAPLRAESAEMDETLRAQLRQLGYAQ